MEKICSSLVSEKFYVREKKSGEAETLIEGEIDAYCEKGGYVEDIWGFEGKINGG